MKGMMIHGARIFKMLGRGFLRAIVVTISDRERNPGDPCRLRGK
jgi:hypothetical protein